MSIYYFVRNDSISHEIYMHKTAVRKRWRNTKISAFRLWIGMGVSEFDAISSSLFLTCNYFI